jgi:hypothetical protein
LREIGAKNRIARAALTAKFTSGSLFAPAAAETCGLYLLITNGHMP